MFPGLSSSLDTDLFDSAKNLKPSNNKVKPNSDLTWRANDERMAVYNMQKKLQ